MSAIPAKVRTAVHERAKGRCEGCGRIAPLELHHRKYRSRGGKHTASNLVALCGWGNHTGCHGRAHGPNPPQGWSLPSGRCDPAEELFLHHWGLIYLKE
ncbi:HNH endonuclease [Microbacterium sp. K22]|nr:MULTISPECIES: HNH endonuclease [unclassified Microbacterium]